MEHPNPSQPNSPDATLSSVQYVYVCRRKAHLPESGGVCYGELRVLDQDVGREGLSGGGAPVPGRVRVLQAGRH